MSELAHLGKQPAVLVAVGAVATAGSAAATAYRFCEQLPYLGPLLRDTREQLARRGEIAIARGTEPLKALVESLALEIVRMVLQQLDLTALVREEVDIDAIITDVDIDAIVARIDLVGLANHVIDGVDLPTIIRDSTGTVTAEVMSDVRTQGERADDAVSNFVDRMLRRRELP